MENALSSKHQHIYTKFFLKKINCYIFGQLLLILIYKMNQTKKPLPPFTSQFTPEVPDTICNVP